jgi:hypothetical protein
MPLRLIRTKRTLGFKIESTAYSAETLAVTDYVFSAFDINYSPEVEMYMRKLSRGDWSRDKSIAGRQKATVSFKYDLNRGAAAATASQCFNMLKACGMKLNTYGATGCALLPDAGYGNVPATIEVVEKQEGATPQQLVIKLAGCMGNAKFSCDPIGKPIGVEFEFTGRIESITTRAYASMITPTGFDVMLPDAVLAATVLLYGTTQFLSKFSIDLGNTVETFTDPTRTQGIDGAHIVDRNVTMEIDPDMLITSDAGLYANQLSNTTGALSITIGSNIVISAPAAQIEDAYKPGDREGHVVNQIKLGLKRSVGNDEFEILQGSKS